MYSNFSCGFLCRILPINQGYTYSNILDLSRKISAMSIADILLHKVAAAAETLDRRSGWSKCRIWS